MPYGLYLHMPFCSAKCDYCDFFSVVPASRRALCDYVETLCLEMELCRQKWGRCVLDTVYFGGGSPSLFSALDIERVMDLVRKSFDLKDDAEVTMEFHPRRVGRGELEQYRGAGINRISVGVEELDEDILRAIGRRGGVVRIDEWMDTVRLAGFSNLSVDFMLGLPGQTVGHVQRMIQFIERHQIVHVSAYPLIVHDGLRMDKRIRFGEICLPGEEEERSLVHAFRSGLQSIGREAYEISNYALPGWESRHNRKYWTLDPYLACGAGACGFDGQARYRNPENLALYRKQVRNGVLPAEIEYVLSRKDAMSEFSFLSIRMREGISYQGFRERFEVDFWTVFSKSTFERHRQNGLVRMDGAALFLTQKGRDLANLVEVDLLL